MEAIFPQSSRRKFIKLLTVVKSCECAKRTLYDVRCMIWGVLLIRLLIGGAEAMTVLKS